MTGDKSLTQKKRSKKERQKLFLAEFAQNANILLSARKAGVSRNTVYQWQEHDQDFSFAFNQAKEDANDMLRAEIYRRAVEGVPEKVWQLGKYCGEVTKYSDTLLIFLAKSKMPEFRDKQQIDINATHSNQRDPALQHATDEEIELLASIQNRLNQDAR